MSNDLKNMNSNRTSEDLVREIKEKLPNIVLPSMGMFDDSELIDIDGKKFILKDNDKEV